MHTAAASTSASSSAASSPVTAQPQAQGQGRGARRVTAEQKRHLQAKAAQRSKTRQGGSAGTLLGSAVRTSPSPARDGVELGEEATSAMAVQSLSQSTTGGGSGSGSGSSSRPPGGGGPSRAGQKSGGPGSGKAGSEGRLDIPLEDLSTRGKQLRGLSLERARLSRLAREVGSLSNHGHQQASATASAASSASASHGLAAPRSHSLSPHRSRQETSCLMSRRDPRRQSAPISIPASSAGRSSASTHSKAGGQQQQQPPQPSPQPPPPQQPLESAWDSRRPHSRSNPVPIPGRGKPGLGGSSSDDSPEGGRARSWSGPTPKSLQPAAAPPASLLVDGAGSGPQAAAVVVPSAMLLPPERTTILRRSQADRDKDEEEVEEEMEVEEESSR